MFPDIQDYTIEYGGPEKPVNSIKPLVSVCLSTYNQQDFIEQCIEGVLAQKTNFPIEIIIGEDDSTDETRNICKAYADKYPDKIRLMLRSEKNKWYVGGRKTGRFNYVNNLRQSRGKYIAWCDGDDYWCNPTKLQQQVDFLEANPGYVFSFHECQLLTDGKFEPSNYYVNRTSTTFQADEIIATISIPTSSMCFRNDYEWKFSPGFYYSFNGDSMLFAFLVTKYEALAYHHKDLDGSSVYRIQSRGVWSSQNQYSQFKNTLNTLLIIRKDAPKKYQQLLLKKVHAMSGYLAKEDFKAKRFKEFFKNYRYWIGTATKSSIRSFIRFHILLISA